ncbi:MAG: hypothetical protein EA376_02485 [Phycisphaeraceae bacterium]|nr:MAG: hypothetical protein EA376_02485 [Phycisphaeraceae bacterium]
MHVAGAILFLSCAAASYLVSLAVMAEPASVQDRTGEMNAILDSALPQGADATPLLVEAHAIANGLRDGKALSMGLLLRGEWGDPRLEDERALWLSYADEVIPLIRSAAQGGAIRNPFVLVEGRVTTQADANDALYWIMYNVVLIGLRESYENADWERHFEWVDIVSNLIRMSADRPAIMDVMLARAMCLSLYREIRTQAIEGRLPESACHRLIEHLQTMDRHLPDFATVGAMHRLEMHTSFDRWFAPSGLAVLPALMFEQPWHEDPPRAILPRLRNVRALLTFRRADAERELDKRIADLVESVRSGDQAPQPEQYERWGSVVISGLDGLPSVARWWRWPETDRIGTVLMLRLAAYHAAHGRWPETLADAAPEEEMIDPQSGKPFLYELTPNDRRGAPFRLAAAPSPEHGRGKWPFSHPREGLGNLYELR